MTKKHSTKIAIEVRKTPKAGRGVFALKDFAPGEIIEKCPIINVTPKERKHIEKTILNFYVYPWRSTRSGSIVLGYGSIYNHSFTPMQIGNKILKLFLWFIEPSNPSKKEMKSPSITMANLMT